MKVRNAVIALATGASILSFAGSADATTPLSCKLTAAIGNPSTQTITTSAHWSCNRNPAARVQSYPQHYVNGHWVAIVGTTATTTTASGGVGGVFSGEPAGTYRAVSRLQGNGLNLLVITPSIKSH